MAKQTRIERQEKAKIESVSFDRFAADVFQSYVQSEWRCAAAGRRTGAAGMPWVMDVVAAV